MRPTQRSRPQGDDLRVDLPTSTPSTPAPRRRWFLGIAAGNFLVLLDTSILNVALPDVRSDLGASAAQLPWAVTAYTVVFASLLLAAGATADRLGPLRLYRTAVAGFALLSLLCAAAPTMGALIGGRALLGVAAAGMVPPSLALLVGLYPDPRRRAHAIGAWAAVTSIGLLSGPLLGGLLVSFGGWRWVFLVNPPIALLALAASRGLIGGRPPQARPWDPSGLVLSAVGLGTLTFGLIDGGTGGWARPAPVAALGVSALAWVLLSVVEGRAQAPVLPPSLLRMPRVLADLVAAAVATLVFYGVLFSLTQWLQDVRGFSALETGLAFVPMTLPMCFLPWVCGRLVGRYGARPVIIGGLSAAVAAGGCLAAAGPGRSLGWVIAAEIALVLACTSTIPAATADMSAAAPPQLAATGQGALNAARQAGSALGVALMAPLASVRSVGAVIVIGSVLALLVVLG
jgi:MFS transporter, DHA2 family, methylenomycin A resistance protein